MTKWSVLHLKNIQTLVEGGRKAVKKNKDVFPPFYLHCFLNPSEPSQPCHYSLAEVRCPLRQSLPCGLCLAHLVHCRSASKSQFSTPSEQLIQKKSHT